MRQIIILIPLFLFFFATTTAIGQDKSQAGDFKVGVHSHITRPKPFGNEFQLRDTLFSILKQSGIRLIRTDFAWKEIQPKPGVWNWEATDEIVKKANQRGIEILALLYAPPKWAVPLDIHKQEWEEFVSRVSKRYSNKIRFWEIWNEPNTPHFWPKSLTPRFYYKIAKNTSRILKSVNSENKVIMGGMLANEYALKFWEEIFNEGGLKYCDGIGVHPYKYPAEQLLGYISKVRTLMRDYGSVKPIWITEYGSSSKQTRADTMNMDSSFEEQHTLLAKTLLSAWAVDVRSFIAFELIDKEVNKKAKQFGLIKSDLDFKPSFSTFTKLNSFTEHHTVRKVTVNKDGVTISFTKVGENNRIRFMGWGNSFLDLMKQKGQSVQPFDIVETKLSKNSIVYIAK